MENEVVLEVANEGVEACSIMSKTCVIGKALLISAILGGIVLISVKAIKKTKLKKAAKKEMLATGENKQD